MLPVTVTVPAGPGHGDEDNDWLKQNVEINGGDSGVSLLM